MNNSGPLTQWWKKLTDTKPVNLRPKQAPAKTTKSSGSTGNRDFGDRPARGRGEPTPTAAKQAAPVKPAASAPPPATGWRGNLGYAPISSVATSAPVPWWQQIGNWWQNTAAPALNQLGTPNGLGGGNITPIITPRSLGQYNRPATYRIGAGPQQIAPGWTGDLGLSRAATPPTASGGHVGSRDMSAQYVILDTPTEGAGFGSEYDWWKKRYGGGYGGGYGGEGGGSGSTYVPAWMLGLNQWNYGE